MTLQEAVNSFTLSTCNCEEEPCRHEVLLEQVQEAMLLLRALYGALPPARREKTWRNISARAKALIEAWDYNERPPKVTE